ncbi:hypothetical protein Glove_186g93 [Diversispora epigaea]|uniref:Uncharacterized protein n=1 Tax=Diversispora epigaea TaxID=1348612 RepID=A0A397IWS8_9GLOM|nr:hypothetical protein Glove_186g93 [Diversispora epigaea]
MPAKKLIYQRGTCFGCRKCLYCAVDLQKTKCKCDLNLLPSKSNRTEAVKYAFMRSFEPSWTQVKLKFIQDKITEYNYKLNFNKSFKFSLCGKCNSILVKLNLPKSKPKTDSNTSISSIDLSTNSNMSISRDNSEENLLHLTNDTTTFTTIDLDDEFSDDENEFEISFKIFIKLVDGTSIPAKWYKETIASIDEFLYIIHEKVIRLLSDDTIEASNYRVAFKGERASGAGTQLVDAQDFINFRFNSDTIQGADNRRTLSGTTKKLANSQNVQHCKYVCNCLLCNSKEVVARTQEKHANNKELWKSKSSRKNQLARIESRKYKNENVSLITSSKKRKRSSRQFIPDEETARLPKLKRDTSISNMLSGMDFDDEIIVASSSRSRNDQFHNPLIEETPDIFDDMLLYNLGDNENNENNELINDLEEYRDNNNELIDDLEEYRDDDNELIDD